MLYALIAFDHVRVVNQSRAMLSQSQLKIDSIKPTRPGKFQIEMYVTFYTNAVAILIRCVSGETQLQIEQIVLQMRLHCECTWHL